MVAAVQSTGSQHGTSESDHQVLHCRRAGRQSCTDHVKGSIDERAAGPYPSLHFAGGSRGLGAVAVHGSRLQRLGKGHRALAEQEEAAMPALRQALLPEGQALLHRLQLHCQPGTRGILH